VTNRKLVVVGGLLLALVSALVPAQGRAALQEQQQEQKPPAYTRAEYDAFVAAQKEANAQQRLRLLNDFTAKYPESDLRPYTYQLLYTTYNELKNFPKTVEYIDKVLDLGDRIDLLSQLQALYMRATVFEFAFSPRDPDAREGLQRATDAAKRGMEVLGKAEKPQNATDEQWAQFTKLASIQFETTAGFAALQLKDYVAAAAEFRDALAIDPNLGPTWYRLGVAYLQQEPPRYQDGFWAIARSIALKIPNDAQVRSYLKTQVQRYQLTACDKEVEAQMNELIALATSSVQRPMDYRIPSAQELAAARENGANFMQVLQGGGREAKLMWLAMCGLEFPEVVGKVISVGEGNDSVIVQLYLGTTNEETLAGETPNMEVIIKGEPRAKLLKKDDPLKFSATLVNYSPDPFMVYWDKATIAEDFLPADQGQSGKRPRKRPGS